MKFFFFWRISVGWNICYLILPAVDHESVPFVSSESVLQIGVTISIIFLYIHYELYWKLSIVANNLKITRLLNQFFLYKWSCSRRQRYKNPIYNVMLNP